jgi:hypothetical protein
MRLNYDNLKRISREARSELLERGEIDPGKRRIRRKPRDPEKLDQLYCMAIDRMERYRPFKDEKGRLVFPYLINRLP